LRKAIEFRKEYRRDMKALEKKKEEIYDKFGETSQEYIEAEKAYYYDKAKVDVLTSIVKETRQAAKAAQAKVDEARLGGGISSYDQRKIDEKIAEANAETNAAGEPDQDAIFNALKNLEEEYEFEMLKWEKKLDRKGDKAGDVLKTQTLDAQYRFNYLSEQLGPNSPAKFAAKEADIKAAAEAALRQLTASVTRAKDLEGVMKYVAQATKNTSPLPALLANSKTSDDMKAVLRIVSEEGNEDLAR
jgi:hypothetical protein